MVMMPDIMAAGKQVEIEGSTTLLILPIPADGRWDLTLDVTCFLFADPPVDIAIKGKGFCETYTLNARHSSIRCTAWCEHREQLTVIATSTGTTINSYLLEGSWCRD